MTLHTGMDEHHFAILVALKSYLLVHLGHFLLLENLEQPEPTTYYRIFINESATYKYYDNCHNYYYCITTM